MTKLFNFRIDLRHLEALHFLKNEGSGDYLSTTLEKALKWYLKTTPDPTGDLKRILNKTVKDLEADEKNGTGVFYYLNKRGSQRTFVSKPKDPSPVRPSCPSKE